MIVAIQPDDYTAPDAPDLVDQSSLRWAVRLREAGIEVRWVDVTRSDIIAQVRGADGFMWRWGHVQGMAKSARRLLPVLEKALNLVVYPDWNTSWHYDDKVAQSYLFEALGLPTPKTWAFFDERRALEWAGVATFPTVMKLAVGAGASNVVLIESRRDAASWIRRLFSEGVRSIADAGRPASSGVTLDAVRNVLGRNNGNGSRADVERGYALFQEFVPGNTFDTRVTVIGSRAFAFRRFNRHGDFRASGSGNIDWTAEAIDPECVRIAFDSAAKLDMQCCAFDFIASERGPLIVEVSYTFASWAVFKCPGHWTSTGGPTPIWSEGCLRPEDAQVDDFLRRLRRA